MGLTTIYLPEQLCRPALSLETPPAFPPVSPPASQATSKVDSFGLESPNVVLEEEEDVWPENEQYCSTEEDACETLLIRLTVSTSTLFFQTSFYRV